MLTLDVQMVILRKDPQGTKIFERRDSTHQSFSVSMNDAERDRMMQLEKHCRDLETRLSKHEVSGIKKHRQRNGGGVDSHFDTYAIYSAVISSRPRVRVLPTVLVHILLSPAPTCNSALL